MAQLEEWKYKKGKYQRVVASEQKCTVQSGPDGEAKCVIKTEKGGSYTIKADVTDKKGLV